MNLYLIHYDGEPYYVEAPSLEEASDLWKLHVKKEWEEAYNNEEPESIALMHDYPVIRAESFI